MSSYRVEISPNNRAGCQDKVCKDSGNKITKGELRLGVWFTMPGTEHGSWKWRHWGCVSGKTISNIQESVQKGSGYDWNMLDGYDEISDEDLKKKIERVVTQGHIDPEDFNGDPEFNVPGKTAIRGRAKKVKAGEEEADEDAAASKKPTKNAAGAKRGRKKADEADEEEEEEVAAAPAKKKARAGRKTKKVVEDEDEDEAEEKEVEAPQPVKKGRAGRKVKESKKEEAEDEEEAAADEKPAKKLVAAKNGNKKAAAAEAEAAPEKKKGGRKAQVKKAPSPGLTNDEEKEKEQEQEQEQDEDEEPVVKTIAKAKAKAKAGRKSSKAGANTAQASKGGRRGRSAGKVEDEE